MSAPAPLVVKAVQKHTATVIFAHGLGDSGAGWMPIAENWRRRGKFEEVAFVFPNAPTIPITVNYGMRMPGWYDITTFNDLEGKSYDETGILKSRDYLNSLIKAETEKGIPSSRIVLGGFSQGGAMALFSGITSPHKLGGIVGLSSYLLLHTKIDDFIPKDTSNKDTPVFIGHGDSDPMVRYEWGQNTAKFLKERGFKVDFHTYKDLAHSADPEEIDDVEKFIKDCLPPQEG